MSKFLVSLDGGATKTNVCLYNIEDESVAMFEFGGSNYKEIGLDGLEAMFLNAVEEIYDALDITSDDIKGAVMGFSGLDSEKDKQKISDIVIKSGISREKIFLCNDGELIMYSSASVPGICVVSGTGSVAYGYDEGLDIVRAGGHDRWFSDLGSGYWVATQVLREYVKYLDDIVPYMGIFEEIEGFYAKKPEEMIEFINSAPKEEIASLAKLVLDNGADGDPLCEAIMKGAAYNLANLVQSVYTRLDTSDALKLDLVMVGSLFKNEKFYELFSEQCVNQTTYKNINFVKFVTEPSEIAVDFAKRLFLA